MKAYRKLDQYYVDNYDRTTISILKEIEEHERADNKNTHFPWVKRFHGTAVRRAKNKNEAIRKRIMEDEQKDRLVRLHPVPDNVRCNTCNTRMWFKDYWFRSENSYLLFAFTCPKNHTPNKILYPNGEEYFHPARKCDRCGSELTSTSEKQKGILRFTDTCTGCGKVIVNEYDMILDQETPIIEEERKKYCTDFIGRKTFFDELKEISDFVKAYPEIFQAEKEKIDISTVKKLSIPQLEQALAEKTGTFGFIKFQFDKPKIAKHVVVQFSVQDPTDRNGNDSTRVLTKLLKEALLPTNWRLMATGVSCRLGFLSGEIKGYDQEDDLIRIAKETMRKSKT